MSDTLCEGCGQHSFLLPLHGGKGGPLRCPLCVGKWNAEHGRKRRTGRPTPCRFTTAMLARPNGRSVSKRNSSGGSAKQRAEYKRRRDRKLRRRPQRRCETCGAEFKRTRTDARYCSATCRQRAHRKAVTDKSRTPQGPKSNRHNGERGILALLERHQAVFLNDLLPEERTRAQYQALVLTAVKLEDEGKIDSWSYAYRWDKPGSKVLLRRGYQLKNNQLDAKHIHRLTAKEQRAFAGAER